MALTRALAGSIAIDIWENAVVAGAINAALLLAAFALALLVAALGGVFPEVAILVSALALVALPGLLGPVGIFLELVCRRETPRSSWLTRRLASSFVASCLVGLAGCFAISLVLLWSGSMGPATDAVEVAIAIVSGWAVLAVSQWMLFAICLTEGDVPAPWGAAKRAAVIVLARPVFAMAVLLAAALLTLTVFILLPGPAAAALLVRRAARFAMDPEQAARSAEAFSRRSAMSVLFPWKS